MNPVTTMAMTALHCDIDAIAAIEVSVIMATRNARQRIAPAIEAVLVAIDHANLNVEFIVADNASTDRTAELIESRWPSRARVLRVDALGASSAKNAAVHSSRGDIVLFLDDDICVPENWVEALTSPLRAGDADIVCGAIRLAPHLDRRNMTDYHRRLLADTGPGLGIPPTTVVGGSMAVTRTVFDSGIWFHPELGPGQSGFMEEHMWFREALDSGYRAVGVDAAPVTHHVDPSRLERIGWLTRAIHQGRSEALARVLYTPDSITFRDSVRGLRAVVRRGVYAVIDRRRPIPSSRYLQAVAAQHATIGFIQQRRRRRSPVTTSGVRAGVAVRTRHG